jgi:hypothetical protein
MMSSVVKPSASWVECQNYFFAFQLIRLRKSHVRLDVSWKFDCVPRHLWLLLAHLDSFINGIEPFLWDGLYSPVGFTVKICLVFILSLLQNLRAIMGRLCSIIYGWLRLWFKQSTIAVLSLYIACALFPNCNIIRSMHSTVIHHQIQWL